VAIMREAASRVLLAGGKMNIHSRSGVCVTLTIIAAISLSGCGRGDPIAIAAYNELALIDQTVSVEAEAHSISVTSQSVVESTPVLAFNSGFEPNSSTTLQDDGSQKQYMYGIDNSVAAPNDWDNFSADPGLGSFYFEYEAGSPTQRGATIIPYASAPDQHMLRFQIKEANVGSAETGKGRVQASIVGNVNLKNFYYTVKLFVPNNLTLLKYYDHNGGAINWLTIMEFWNNPPWVDSAHPFRISLNLVRPEFGTELFYLRLTAQKANAAGKFVSGENIWEHTDLTPLPLAKWLSLTVHFVEGKGNSGRAYLAIAQGGSTPRVVFDVSNTTCHPDDPSPDGFTHISPMKLYTSAKLISYLKGKGSSLYMYWDNFAFYREKFPAP
jgi:hypothetical protein